MENTYLDYAATTPVDPDVLNSMIPYFTEKFGNPSSIHRHGQKAEAALETAREKIAFQISCDPGEIIFTSGGSEADNLAIRGTALARRSETHADRILITPVEHEAVKRTAKQMQDLFGFRLEFIPVDSEGRVILAGLEEMLTEEVALVSAIFGNNEIGTINNVNEIGALCSEQGIPFHTDAVQAMGYIDIKSSDNISLISAGAHKFYGPKGVGFLYRTKNVRIYPYQTGGSQENGLRAGTHNVPYIVGMATALELTRSRQKEYEQQFTLLRNQIIDGVLSSIPFSTLTGSASERLCNHASFIFEGIDGNELAMALDIEGFSCSSGSACKTGNPEPSEVLLAIGLNKEQAKGSLRVTVGRKTTEKDICGFLEALHRVLGRIKA
jgi:cysteine desulfurase